jgi:hypothetical protein
VSLYFSILSCIPTYFTAPHHKIISIQQTFDLDTWITASRMGGNIVLTEGGCRIHTRSLSWQVKSWGIPQGCFMNWEEASSTTGTYNLCICVCARKKPDCCFHKKSASREVKYKVKSRN